VNVGGSFNSNTISASVVWSEEFQPQLVGRNPFVTVLTASLTVHIKNAQMAIATITNPGEKTQYTITGGSYLYGPYESKTTGGFHHKTGKFTVKGIVVDEEGNAIAGAAVKVGKDVVWTNAQGQFQLSQKKAATLDVAVDLEEFTALGDWSIVDAPKTVTAATTGTPIKIVVRKV
jgi:protocatechuate 3,4-dioxygenase beta subunit